MKNAKELRELTDSQRAKLLEKAKQRIFKSIESAAESGRNNYTLDSKNSILVEHCFFLETSEFEDIKEELKSLGFNIDASRDFPLSSAIVSW